MDGILDQAGRNDVLPGIRLRLANGNSGEGRVTPEQLERMTRLEVEMRHLKEATARIETKVDALGDQANIGRGALWVFMAVGGVVVAVATRAFERVFIGGN